MFVALRWNDIFTQKNIVVKYVYGFFLDCGGGVAKYLCVNFGKNNEISRQTYGSIRIIGFEPAQAQSVEIFS